MTMPTRNLGPRGEYQLKARERINQSPTLKEQYPKLKSLKVEMRFFSPDGAKTGGFKYKFNLESAKSLFIVACPNGLCVSGDFDLSQELKEAIASKVKTLKGEKRCEGWKSKETIDTTRCQTALHYEISLGY